MSTSTEALHPGFAWNATRVASVLMVVIIAVIALVFWPAFSSLGPPPAGRPAGQRARGAARAVVVNGEVCLQCLP